MLRATFGILLLLLASLCLAQDPKPEVIQARYRELIRNVSLERLAQTYQKVSTFGSRLAGSKGEAAALAFAESEFRRLGLRNVRRETFTVSVPDPEAVGRLTGSGATVEVYPLWPNLVRTSTCDVSGPLVYGGSGTLEELAGKDVSGAIVLLEFTSGANWRQAAKLGAAAIVFVGAEIPRVESEMKFTAVPLDIPRFYLPLKGASRPLTAALTGQKWRLQCRQPWVSLQSANVLGDLPGADAAARDEIVLVSGYVDSMSVVPKLAPGAESTGGLAVMLELAEVFRKERHRRTIRFMASGAHFLAMQGAREYVERRLRTGDDQGLLAAVTLDVHSGSRGLGVFGRGWFYEYRNESIDVLRNVARLLRRHADRIAPVVGALSPRLVLTDAVNHSDNRTWKNNIPARFAFDCEPFVQARINGLTFATIDTARETVDTPADTLEKVNLANVTEQAKTMVCMMHHLLNDTSEPGAVGDHTVPLKVTTPSRMSLVGGFATVEGKVAIYDPQKGFVPNVLVPGAVAILENPLKSMMGVRGTVVNIADAKAHYRFIGAPPISSWWRPQAREVQIAAFKLDDRTGDITHAPSFGLLGGEEYSTVFDLTSSYKSTPIVVFKCVAIDFYDLVDPQDLKTFGDGDILDAATDAYPTRFGFFVPLVYQRSSAEVEDTATMFLEPGQKFKLLLGSGLGEIRMILTNSTAEMPSGVGYLAPGDPKKEPKGRDRESIVNGRFRFPSLHSARDILAINDQRLQKFAEHRIISEGINHLQQQAKDALVKADAAQDAKDWPALNRHARAAWGYALRAHPIIQKTANDVVNGVIFYLFLLIPFSAFVERLVWGHRSLTKQLAYAMGVFVASFVTIRFIHPAFEIVSNPSMIFIAFVMGTLSLIVIAFIAGKFETSLKALRQSESGVHEVDIRRVSVAMAAFNLGVSNMRRRKARTILTTLTLVVMTFIVLSFTSIVPEVRMNEQPADTEARYTGILVRNPGLEPMENNTYTQLENEFRGRATVVRRAWYYGADIGDQGVLALKNADRISDARALVGMEPGEEKVTRIHEALIPGGRWFQPGDRRAIILPQPLADALNVDRSEVGNAKVAFAGESYTVIGILDSGLLRQLLDLDGDQVLPADFNLSNRLQQETNSSTEAFRQFIRLDPAQVFFLPLETALNVGADIRSLAVGFPEAAGTRKALDELMPRLRLNLYAAVPSGEGLEVRQFSVFQAQKGSGIGLILVQMAIASVFILNTMIASVFERRREISIFSAVGLAPNHIAMLFFAESLVYGVLGAVFGYIGAQSVAKLIVETGALPGLYLNFSSTSAVMAAGLVMGVVLLSTIYPARVAAQIAAPAQDQDELGEEPEGDVWELQLPFSVSEAEAGPLLQFLGEWYAAYEEYTIGDFVTAGTKVEHGHDSHSVSTRAWLAPYDLAVAQDLVISASSTPVPGVYRLDLRLERVTGEHPNWVTVNRRFLANLRKQFLTWRTLDADQRLKYEQRAVATAEVG